MRHSIQGNNSRGKISNSLTPCLWIPGTGSGVSIIHHLDPQTLVFLIRIYEVILGREWLNRIIIKTKITTKMCQFLNIKMWLERWVNTESLTVFHDPSVNGVFHTRYTCFCKPGNFWKRGCIDSNYLIGDIIHTHVRAHTHGHMGVCVRYDRLMCYQDPVMVERIPLRYRFLSPWRPLLSYTQGGPSVSIPLRSLE